MGLLGWLVGAHPVMAMSKTKQQLAGELAEVRRRLVELEGADAERRRALAALDESERRYQDLYHHAPDMYFTVARDGTILAANQFAAQRLGYDHPEELIGQAVSTLVHSGDRAAVEQQIAAILAAGTEAGELRYRKVRKDGAILWVHERVRVIPGTASTPAALQIVCRDITRYKDAERALQESEQRYRALVESSLGLICLHDLEGNLLSVNPAAARALGYQPAEGLGRTLAEFLPEDARPLFQEYLERIRRNGIDEGVMRVRTRDGCDRLWAYRNVLCHSDGQPPYVLGHAVDVTDLKRAENAARESEAKYRALVEHATYGIYRSTLEGRFLAVNPALVTMLGYASEVELMAVDMASALYADPAERARLIGQYKASGKFEDVEVPWKRKDGSPIIVRLSGRVVSNGPDDECFEVIVEDVTERRVLQAQLQQAQKMEAIGRLTGGIAHDFNNLLTVIIASADLIKTALPPDRPDLRADLEELRAAARRGTAIVKKLLGFSRRQQLVTAPVNLSEIAAEFSESLKRLLPENIEIRVVREPSLHLVRADRGAVEQILVNLATNAADAMPKGGLLCIETRRAWLDDDHRARRGWGEPGLYVCLTVSDTGAGMDAHTLERVFEPFFTTKSPGKGTGLGMSMIYGLTKQQHGYVDVQSQLGEGTTVSVYFPATGDPHVPAPRRFSIEHVPVGTETILVVEDEEPVRRAARRVLEKYGYSVVTADDGEHGLALLRADPSGIALVLSDVVMPRMGGPELYEALRVERPGLKFLFTSGYTAKDVRASTQLDPKAAFLHKPWTPTELLIRIRELLDNC